MIWFEHFKLRNIKKIKACVKMEKAIIKSGEIGIENQKFYQYKKLVSIKKYILIK